MADYTDKEAKKLYPADFERLKAWRKALNAPLAQHVVARLQQLSTEAQELWDKHTKALARDRARTEDPRWMSGRIAARSRRRASMPSAVPRRRRSGARDC